MTVVESESMSTDLETIMAAQCEEEDAETEEEEEEEEEKKEELHYTDNPYDIVKEENTDELLSDQPLFFLSVKNVFTIIAALFYLMMFVWCAVFMLSYTGIFYSKLELPPTLCVVYIGFTLTIAWFLIPCVMCISGVYETLWCAVGAWEPPVVPFLKYKKTKLDVREIRTMFVYMIPAFVIEHFYPHDERTKKTFLAGAMHLLKMMAIPMMLNAALLALAIRETSKLNSVTRRFLFYPMIGEMDELRAVIEKESEKRR